MKQLKIWAMMMIVVFLNLGLGDNCYINNAIIDKNARVGNNVRINGGDHLKNADHELYTVKDGIVVIKKDAVST